MGGELQQVLGEVQDLESKTRRRGCQLRKVGKLPWVTEKKPAFIGSFHFFTLFQFRLVPQLS